MLGTWRAIESLVDQGRCRAIGLSDIDEQHIGEAPNSARGITLGLSHEQQHQDFALTDFTHASFSNPLRSAYRPRGLAQTRTNPVSKLRWLNFPWGLIELSYSPNTDGHLGFCFDDETPRHHVYLLAEHRSSAGSHIHLGDAP